MDKLKCEALYNYLLATWSANQIWQRQYHELLDLARKYGPSGEVEELYHRHYREIDKHWTDCE